MDQPRAWSFAATIPAKDLDRTRKFYEDVLGCEVVQDVPSGITYRSGDSFFDLYATQFAGTAQHTLGGFYVDDIDAAVDDLTAKGVAFEHYDFPGLKTNEKGIADLDGELSAWFKDPEGNILAIAQRTEV